MTFGEKILKARKEKKLTQREVAELLGAKHNSISNWEKDLNRPDFDTIEGLCRVLDISPNYLMGEDDVIDVFSIAGILPLPKMTLKPRLGTIACGEPILAEENIIGYDKIPFDIHCDFTLVCKGDSMIGARIYDGDIVYIRAQSDIDNGEIAAVLLDGNEATLKRVYKYEDKVVLQPENPKYAPLVFVRDEINSLRILGKAVGFTSVIV